MRTVARGIILNIRHLFRLAAALSAALAVSLAANLALAIQLHEAFGRLHFARIFPLGYAPRAVAPDSDAAIAFYGDSRALHWAISRRSKQAVLNLAHGGQTSAQLRLQLATEPAVTAPWAVVQVGINDLHPLAAVAADRAEVKTALIDNLEAILGQLEERSENVILTTIIPPSTTPLLRKPVTASDLVDLVADVNARIGTFASRPRVRLLDGAALLGTENGLLNPRFVDEAFFLHLNPLAHEVLDEELDRLLDTSIR